MQRDYASKKDGKVNWLSVGVFYVMACAISWPFFWWRDMEPESWSQLRLPNFLKTWSYMWGPGVSALLCFLILKKTHRKTISFFGSSKIKSVVFYVVPILALAAVGISGQGMNNHLFPIVFGAIGFISILGEELGWRGYLQDALQPLPEWKKYLLIGTMWELWHFTNRMGHGDIEQIFVRVLIWISALTLLSFLIGKATERSQSVVVAVTLHAWIDIVAEFNEPAKFIVLGGAVPFWAYMIWRWGLGETVR